MPAGFEEIPTSIADLGGAELDLRLRVRPGTQFGSGSQVTFATSRPVFNSEKALTALAPPQSEEGEVAVVVAPVLRFADVARLRATTICVWCTTTPLCNAD